MISTGLLLTRERQIQLWRWRQKGKACKKNLGEQPSEGETANIRRGMKTGGAPKPTWIHLGESHRHLSQNTASLEHAQPREQSDSLSNSLIMQVVFMKQPKGHICPITTPRDAMYLQYSVLRSARTRAIHPHQWHQLKEC